MGGGGGGGGTPATSSRAESRFIGHLSGSGFLSMHSLLFIYAQTNNWTKGSLLGICPMAACFFFSSGPPMAPTCTHALKS